MDFLSVIIKWLIRNHREKLIERARNPPIVQTSLEGLVEVGPSLKDEVDSRITNFSRWSNSAWNLNYLRFRINLLCCWLWITHPRWPKWSKQLLVCRSNDALLLGKKACKQSFWRQVVTLGDPSHTDPQALLNSILVHLSTTGNLVLLLKKTFKSEKS